MITLCTVIGRLAMMLAFQMSNDAVGALVCFVYPILLISFLAFRGTKTARVSLRQDSKQVEMVEHVGMCVMNFRIIADYFRRPLVVDQFEHKVADLNKATSNADIVQANNKGFAPLLTKVIIAFWVI